MNRFAIAALIAVFVVPTVAAAVITPALQGGSCLQQDGGYGLVGSGGKIDPVKLYTLAVEKFRASNLNGRTDSSLAKFGVTTGDPREWARLFVMVCQQESGCRQAPVNSDGSLQKFSSTPSGERSYGPLQFNIGEYGLNSWAEVNSPSCDIDAYIRVAQQGKLLSYFGSMKRPNETMQHAGWFNQTVAPYADSATLNYDPEAASRNYQSVTPYLANPYSGNPGSNYAAVPYSGATPYNAMSPAGGSPYASVSPVQSSGGTNGYVSQGSSMPVSQQLGTQAISPYSSLTSNTSATNLQNALNPTPSQTATTPPSQTVVPGAPSVASIYIQPRVASRTGSILISWTSLNMKSGTCTVKQDSQQIAVAQEGSKSIAGSSVSTGTITFTLSCTAQDGSAVAKTDTITVQ